MTNAEAIEILADIGLLGILLAGAVGLTFAMFHSKHPMLGFPCFILWALAGGYSYTLSSDWDFYRVMAFAFILGMGSLCLFGAWDLKRKSQSIGEVEMDKGDGKLIDEKPRKSWFEDDGIADEDMEKLGPIRRRDRRLHKAKQRS